MSRIGKLPVNIPQGVTVDLAGGVLTAKGKLGTLKLPLNTETYFFEIVQGQYGQELVITDGKTARWRFTRAQ